MYVYFCTVCTYLFSQSYPMQYRIQLNACLSYNKGKSVLPDTYA